MGHLLDSIESADLIFCQIWTIYDVKFDNKMNQQTIGLLVKPLWEFIGNSGRRLYAQVPKFQIEMPFQMEPTEPLLCSSSAKFMGGWTSIKIIESYMYDTKLGKLDPSQPIWSHTIQWWMSQIQNSSLEAELVLY